MTPSMVSSRASVSLAPRLTSPVDGEHRIAAVLFDLDGTLYDQRPLRRRMALELAASVLTSPLSASQRIRALQAFRHAQETLRHATQGVRAESQLVLAAERSGVPVATLQRWVEEWMFTRPLKHLPGCLADGTVELLDWLTARAIPVGVFSDYAVGAKLRALGLDRYVSLTLCATDEGIEAFKPHPRGFQEACRRWSLAPSEVLFVGDRIEVDAVGATAAGMPSVIIGAVASTRELPAGSMTLPSLERLRRVLADCR